MRLCHVLLATAVALFSSNEGFVTALSTDTYQNDDNDAAYAQQAALRETGATYTKQGVLTDTGPFKDEVMKVPRLLSRKKHLPVDPSTSESSDDDSESDDVYDSADSGLLSDLSEDDLGLKDLFSSGSGLENLLSLSGSDMDALLEAFGGGKLDKLIGSYGGLDSLLASLDASATGSDDADEKPAPRKTKKKAKALLYDSSEPGSDDGSDMSDLLKSLMGQSRASGDDFDDISKGLTGSGGGLGNLLKSKTDSSLEESNDGDAESDFDDYFKTLMGSGSIPSDLLKESSGADFSDDVPAKAPKKKKAKALLYDSSEPGSDDGSDDDYWDALMSLSGSDDGSDDDYWDALMSLSGSDLLSPGLTDKLDEAESALGSDNPASAPAPAPAPAKTEAAINPNCEGWFTGITSWWNTTFSDGSKACPSERRLRVV